MKVIAGLDIKNNQCVHLLRGDIKTSKVHQDDPISIVKQLDEYGIDAFHITDIDGVFSGQSNMFDLLGKIRQATDKPIYFGGGIRDFETASKILSFGIDKIVLGTVAVKNQELLIDLLDRYPENIAVAADVYKGYVYIEGWEENSSISVDQFLHTLSLIHLDTVIITDISIDGTKSGINEDFVDDILSTTTLKIILSGGITQDSLVRLKNKALYAVIIGTALYEELIAN